MTTVQVGYITRCVGLYVIYAASDLRSSVYKSHRDLHLVIYRIAETFSHGAKFRGFRG